MAAGQTIQELSAKLSFDIDQTGLNKFDSLLNKARNTILGFSGYEVVKKLFEFEMNFDRLKKRAEVFGSTLDKSFNLEKMEGITKLLGGGAVGAQNAYAAYVAFVNQIGQAAPDLMSHYQDFVKIASAIQKIKGISFEEAFTQLLSGVLSGNISSLSTLPGVSQTQLAIKQFTLNAINDAAKSPLDPFVIRQKLSVFENFWSEIGNAQEQFAKDIGTTTSQRATETLPKTAEAIGRAGDLLKPAFDGILNEINKFLDGLNGFLKKLQEGKVGDAFEQAGRDIGKGMSSQGDTLFSMIPGLQFENGVPTHIPRISINVIQEFAEQFINALINYMKQKLGIDVRTETQKTIDEFGSLKSNGASPKQLEDFKANHPGVPLSLNFGDINIYEASDSKMVSDEIQKVITEAIMTLG